MRIVADPGRAEINDRLRLRLLKSIQTVLLIVMLFRAWGKGRTPSKNSGAKESKWTTTTSRHQKTPKPLHQWQMGVGKSPHVPQADGEHPQL